MPAAAKIPSTRMARLTQMHQRRDRDLVAAAVVRFERPDVVVFALAASSRDELDDEVEDEPTNSGSSPLGAIY